MACAGGCMGNPFSTRVNDVRRLYSPPVSSIKPGVKGVSCGNANCKIKPPLYMRSRCAANCRKRSTCCDRYKKYWAKNCDIPCLELYEDQPWFKDPIIQENWSEFVGDLVTPDNLDCHLQPMPESCHYDCQKVRALMGPAVYCTWDLPDQDECATIRYGYNRDWRRYNEDQRKLHSDFNCDCINEANCKGLTKCEWPPYLGKKFGARYMAWAHPLRYSYPRQQVFNYQSIPTWC